MARESGPVTATTPQSGIPARSGSASLGLDPPSKAGVAPRPNVWTPDSTTGVQDAVRSAMGTRLPLRIVGRGTWLDAGHPISTDTRALALVGLSGIVAYAPGDLTMTVRAGTSLAAIAAATIEHRQWLAVDPFATDPEGGTIGATVATASAGPLAGALGQMRDVVLGLEVVTGDGMVIRSGGRVVKNVAGFDITRLMTGAWGTLGIITEVTVRLRGLPGVDETVAVLDPRGPSGRAPVRPEAQVVDALASGLRRLGIDPIAAEIVNDTLAARLGVPARGMPVLLVRLAGNAERVAQERSTLATLGNVVPVPANVWSVLRSIEPPARASVAVIRWGHLPSHLARTWTHVSSRLEAAESALVHASVTRGVVRAIMPLSDPARFAAGVGLDLDRSPMPRSDHPDAALHGGTEQSASTGSVVPERLPPALWRVAGARPAAEPHISILMQRVRNAFDPHEILNRGILGHIG